MDSHSPAPDRLQRAAGLLRLEVKQRQTRSGIVTLRQEGCLKLLFPRVLHGQPLQAVTVNCSGGIAAGDRLETAVTCRAGTHLLLTAQAPERAYRARPGESAAQVLGRVHLEDGARLEWLPQETILFDQARLRRRLDVEMAAGAHFLGIESRVFGRALHGETLRWIGLSDRITVRRDGRPVLVDALELHGDAQEALSRAATFGGAAAAASIVLVSPDAMSLLEPVRATLAFAGGPLDAGVSAWNGMLRVVMASRDAVLHRTRLASVLSVLRNGQPLPSVWRC